ncbi:uncharacterized protein RCC_06921 [Ramularia collo-cygni]|uniref:Uncharacterized protein n=1 Tax=Ramularia collo-cygni TaxID=112498 RepID=A0A2D3V6K3_9PEZI|nr:uncharacterized protein RCC_06921 [Ramularia collo-cygni]CZT21060.1 uncharacterized protein RCC_06921 [Ramularia collo-cygni]
MANHAANSGEGAYHDTSTIIDLTTGDLTTGDLTTGDLTTGDSTIIDPIADDLDSRIQALPQELQDTILSFTDAFDIPTVVKINEYDDERYCLTGTLHFADFKPPIGLQLNRQLRAKFAKRYFSSVTFECAAVRLTDSLDLEGEPYAPLSGLHHLSKWVESLDETHRSTIGTLRVFEWVVRRESRVRVLPRYGRRIMDLLRGKVTKGTLDQVKLVFSCKVCDALETGGRSVAERRLFDINGIRLDG